jgi:hypothetical protein
VKNILIVTLVFFSACNQPITSAKQDCAGDLIGGYCYGCTDPEACNWDPYASRFDNSCSYIPTGACNCIGEIFDCLGVCGGSAVVDECDVCGGEGIAEGACDCAGNLPNENYDCSGNCIVSVDCTGICGGSILIDECGECGGNGIAEGACDCNGNIFDCAGDCGGNANVDAIGVCGGTCTSDTNGDGVCDD